MADERWTPPRGAVTVTQPDPDVRRFIATCSACKWEYVNSVKTDVQYQKVNHRCPVGTADAYPPCPECGSRTSKCKRPSGHDAWEWHAGRVRLYEGMQ